MATIVSNGPSTGILNSSTDLYGDAAVPAFAFLNAAIDALDVFQSTSFITLTSPHDATHLNGHEPGAGGTLTLVGTGLLGSFSNISVGTKGTITHATFVDDGGIGGFDITGNLAWTAGVGITKGTLTSMRGEDAAGNSLTYTGHMNVVNTVGTGFGFTTGTSLTHIEIVTASGTTFDISGSNMSFEGTTSTFTQFTIADNSGHDITLTGSFHFSDLRDLINNPGTFAGVFDNTLFNAGNDTYTTSEGSAHVWDAGLGNDKMTGNIGADTLHGNLGNDTLDGGGGDDRLLGGGGDDVYFVNSSLDVVIENSHEGKDIVFSSANYTIGDNIENLTLTGTGDIEGNGNAENNVITGNAGSNDLDGGGGLDTLIGGAGDDVYYIHDATTKITDSSGTDLIITDALATTMATNIENLYIASGAGAANATGNTLGNLMHGNSAVNTLSGGAGNDTLDGLGGNDHLDGGAGNDTFHVYTGGETIVDSAGIDTVISTFSYTLATGLENLTLVGATSFSGQGNAANNIITGGTGNDALVGLGGDDTLIDGGGADEMAGNLGNDTYVVGNTGALLIEDAAEGTDTVKSSVNWTLADNFENLVLTSPGLHGIGNAAANTITGSSGTDTLDGGLGADHLIGGLGGDIYYVDNIHDVLTESAPDPFKVDVVNSSVDWTLGTNFENLILTGTAIKGTGNTLNNYVVGNSNNNTLSGGTGDDTLITGGGSDVLTGGTGHDDFVMTGTGPVTITDFKATDDKIDISNILTGYTPGLDSPVDFVRFSAGAPAGHMFLDVDPNGTGDSYTTRITITGTGLTVETLLDTGHLILST